MLYLLRPESLLIGFVCPLFRPPREQRVTGIFVFILTGLSVFMAPILKVVLQLFNSPEKNMDYCPPLLAQSPVSALQFNIISNLLYIRLGTPIAEVM